jgi:hypothetical protein
MAYTFNTGAGAVAPLAGFLFMHGWQTNNQGVPGIAPSGFLFLALSGDSSQQVSLPNNRFGPLGDGTLTTAATQGTATFNTIAYRGGSYGEYVNERGPGVLVFEYQSLNLGNWRENIHGDWVGNEPICGDGKPNLRHAFQAGAVPISPIFSPRWFDLAHKVSAAAVSRPLLNSTMHSLLTAPMAPANWSILGTDVTPGVGKTGCFYLAAQGCFKKLGWWQFPRVGAMLVAPNVNVAAVEFALELTGTSGPMSRDLEHCDVHDHNNVVISPDPPVEVLYINR